MTTNNRIYVSRGNKKIKDTLIWNISAVSTCPFRTEACAGKDGKAGKCYAERAENFRPSVRAGRKRNFEQTINGDFADRMIKQIEREQFLKVKRDLKKGQQAQTYKFFRIHESGDFYSQEYVNQWAKIAEHHSDIHFLVYTKSYPYNFEALKRLPNVQIRYSIDSTTKQARIDMPLAIMQDGQENRNRKTFQCDASMKCHECRVCWVSNIDVAFKLH